MAPPRANVLRNIKTKRWVLKGHWAGKNSKCPLQHVSQPSPRRVSIRTMLEQAPSFGKEGSSYWQPPGKGERRDSWGRPTLKEWSQSIERNWVLYHFSPVLNCTWNLKLCQLYGPISHLHCLSYLNVLLLVKICLSYRCLTPISKASNL